MKCYRPSIFLLCFIYIGVNLLAVSQTSAAMIPFAFWRRSCELNVSWTPAWSNILGYWNLNGVPGASIPNNTAIPAVVGAAGTAKNSGKTYIAGKMGPGAPSGVSFGSSYITMANPTSINGSQLASGTIATWIRPVAFTSSKTVLGKELSYKMEVTDKTGDGSYPSGGITVGFYVSTNGSSWRCSIETQGTIAVNTWTHVAVTWDQTNPIKIYFNGTAQTLWSNCNLASAGVPFNTSYDFQLSGWNGANELFTGSLDEVAVWSTTLSAAQISTLYSTQLNCSY